MIIRKNKTWNNYNTFKGEILDGISFLESRQTTIVYDACCGDINKLITMFKIVGIKFDHINVMMKSCISYSVDGLDLTLADLSSGERFVLYLLACKKLKEEVLAIALFEVLGDRLMNVVYDYLTDYDSLIILLMNVCLDPKFNQYMEVQA